MSKWTHLGWTGTPTPSIGVSCPDSDSSPPNTFRMNRNPRCLWERHLIMNHRKVSWITVTVASGLSAGHSSSSTPNFTSTPLSSGPAGTGFGLQWEKTVLETFYITVSLLIKWYDGQGGRYMDVRFLSFGHSGQQLDWPSDFSRRALCLFWFFFCFVFFFAPARVSFPPLAVTPRNYNTIKRNEGEKKKKTGMNAMSDPAVEEWKRGGKNPKQRWRKSVCGGWRWFTRCTVRGKSRSSVMAENSAGSAHGSAAAKAQLRSSPRLKKLEKLAVYSSCKVTLPQTPPSLPL